jgi:protein-S-isoprenylcysteine O-methyltransferase Ste14
MNDQPPFRWIFIAILVITLFISGYYRRKARQSGDVIPRAREGGLVLAGRFFLAAPLFLSVFAYTLNPDWMAWSSMSVPTWLRWVAVVVGLATLPFTYWVFRSIGHNISETFLTKEDHALVTHGPYRWIRHPLYSSATVAFVSLSLVAANWFILAMALLAMLVLALAVVPREETQLILKFGQAYREYQQRTGRLVPRLNLRRKGERNGA